MCAVPLRLCLQGGIGESLYHESIQIVPIGEYSYYCWLIVISLGSFGLFVPLSKHQRQLHSLIELRSSMQIIRVATILVADSHSSCSYCRLKKSIDDSENFDSSCPTCSTHYAIEDRKLYEASDDFIVGWTIGFTSHTEFELVFHSLVSIQSV